MAADGGWNDRFDSWGQQDCDGKIGKRRKGIGLSDAQYVVSIIV